MATLTKGKTFANGELVTPATIHQLVDDATISGIVNADIAAGAAIADTKLATISSAGKVLPAAVQGTAVITTDSRLSDARTPVTHTHDDRYYTETEMNALLAGKAASSHTHDDRYYTETEIDTKLSGLPVSGHTHTIANVTGLQTALDGKQASGSYAPATGIAATAITGTAVITTDSRLSDARTPTTHTHDASAINAGTLAIARIPTGATATTACIGNDSRLSDARTPTTHTHTIANVTNLQTELDSKVSGSNLGLCSAWVNFNHGRMLGVTNAANGESISVTAGSSSGTWNSTTAFSTGQLGIIYYVTSAGAVPNASLGGINVSTLGFQIRAISGNTATIKLLAGPAATSQTITGNGGTSGFQYISYGIRAQYGVASITKAAAGSHMNFTFNFTNPFDFIDYCYQFQMDARSSADIYIQTKGQSSIQLQVLNFTDASVSSQMNFMAFGL
jgi:hypothetical protein